MKPILNKLVNITVKTSLGHRSMLSGTITDVNENKFTIKDIDGADYDFRINNIENIVEI